MPTPSSSKKPCLWALSTYPESQLQDERFVLAQITAAIPKIIKNSAIAIIVRDTIAQH